MAANITDYLALENAKSKTDQKFEDMLANLEQAKSKIDQMGGNSWSGSSANVFNEVFLELKTTIDRERNEFNNAMDERITMWYNSFTQAEKEEAQRAKTMVE